MTPAPHLAVAGSSVRPAVALLLLAVAAPARAQVGEYQVKAEFLERFTRFVEWPAQGAGDPRAPFVIGILGENPFGAYLDEMAAQRRIKGRPVVVRELPDADEAASCHVLFVARSARRSLRSVLARTSARPVLTVSDTDGFGEEGVLINFYTAGDKVRFEVNDSAMRRSGLKISSKLLQLARVIRAEAAP